MSLIVKDILKMGEIQLEKAGRQDAKLDAELLFRYQFHVDKMGLFRAWGSAFEDELCDKYFELIAIRASGVPLQHITGEQEFMGFKFMVNEKVLIPRQDTETLVEKVLEILPKRSRKRLSVLDLCCGSGAIGISLAKLYKDVKVTASDIDGDALGVARRNAKRLAVEHKVTFVKGNIFEPFRKKFHKVRFDVIVTNPPYIKSREIETLQTEVKDHEPMIALDGGLDGLVFYRKILRDAPKHMKKGGILLMEIGYDQADEISGIAETTLQYQPVQILKDLAGHDRIAICELLEPVRGKKKEK